MESPQWLSEIFALKNSLGSSEFPSGLRPSGMSDVPRELPKANFSRQPLWTFHCLYHSSYIQAVKKKQILEVATVPVVICLYKQRLKINVCVPDA